MTAHGPAIVIIPGSFSYPILYESVATRLRASGYDVHISKHLSSAGKEPPTTPASLYDDAEVARKIIEEEADAGKDVNVVMHSYGGCVGTQAAKGLCRAERTAEGKPGGIVHLLYINAVVPKEGESNVQSHHGLIGMPPNPAWARDGYLFVPPEVVAEYGYSSLPMDEALKIVEEGNSPSQSMQALGDPVTYPAYKHIPVSWFVGDNDNLIVPQLQQIYIDMIEEATSRKVDVVHLATDHSPFSTEPGIVFDFITRVAGAGTLVK